MLKNFDASKENLNSDRMKEAFEHLQKFCQIFEPELQPKIFQTIVQEILQRQFMKSLGQSSESTISDDTSRYLTRFDTEFTVAATLYSSEHTTILAAVNHIDRVVYAVKRIKFSMNEIQPTKVMAEAEIMQQCIHPNIAKYHTSWIEFVFNVDNSQSNNIVDFEFYIQMELCSRENIIEATKGLSIKDKINALISVASGISYLHNKGIIHMNIKPQNILMGINGEPKLCDFGQAISVIEADKNRGKIDNLFTAPEYPKTITEKSDIYSFALVIACVFCEEDDAETVKEFLNGSFSKLPQIPEYLLDIIRKSLNIDPQERPTITVVADALNNASKGLINMYE